MRNHLRNLTRNDYAVGWICALSKEQTAATAMLDQENPDLPKPPACIPEGRMGTHAATACAMQMTSTFPSIRIGLMVGIGGGIPSKVKLGDVVISMPVDQYPGVVQWDFGKARGGGNFRRIGALNSPPTVLLTAMGKLRVRNRLKRNSLLPQYLEGMGKRWPALVPEYSEPPSGLVGSQDPKQRGVGDVHCGLIASGNQVIKDAELRDSIDENLGGKVLCVEMEAAGLTNDFPCIVIRGICDYADERKNDEWQPYAAAVAAACARALLEYVPPSHVAGPACAR
ncbi:unnamed protein product [Penicillium viridicatum]